MALMELFSPALGWSKLLPNMTVKITGLDTLSVTSGTVTAPLFPVLTGTDAAVQYFENISSMPTMAAADSLPEAGPVRHARHAVFHLPKGLPARGGLAADTMVDGNDGELRAHGGLYPFIGDPIRIPAPTTGGTMDFSGGSVTIEIFAGQN